MGRGGGRGGEGRVLVGPERLGVEQRLNPRLNTTLRTHLMLYGRLCACRPRALCRRARPAWGRQHSHRSHRRLRRPVRPSTARCSLRCRRRCSRPDRRAWAQRQPRVSRRACCRPRCRRRRCAVRLCCVCESIAAACMCVLRVRVNCRSMHVRARGRACLR